MSASLISDRTLAKITRLALGHDWNFDRMSLVDLTEIVEHVIADRHAAAIEAVRAIVGAAPHEDERILLEALEEANEEAARTHDERELIPSPENPGPTQDEIAEHMRGVLSRWASAPAEMRRHELTHAAGIALADSTPHHADDLLDPSKTSEADVDAQLRTMGVDPIALAERGAAFVAALPRPTFSTWFGPVDVSQVQSEVAPLLRQALAAVDEVAKLRAERDAIKATCQQHEDRVDRARAQTDAVREELTEASRQLTQIRMGRVRLRDAIRAYTVDAKNEAGEDVANGPAEKAGEYLVKCIDNASFWLREHGRGDVAVRLLAAAATVAEAEADQIRELREAANAFFGGDFGAGS